MTHIIPSVASVTGYNCNLMYSATQCHFNTPGNSNGGAQVAHASSTSMSSIVIPRYTSQ